MTRTQKKNPQFTATAMHSFLLEPELTVKPVMSGGGNWNTTNSCVLQADGKSGRVSRTVAGNMSVASSFARALHFWHGSA